MVVNGKKRGQAQEPVRLEIVLNIQHRIRFGIEEICMRRAVAKANETDDRPDIAQTQGISIHPLDGPVFLSLLCYSVEWIVYYLCLKVGSRGSTTERTKQEHQEKHSQERACDGGRHEYGERDKKLERGLVSYKHDTPGFFCTH